MTAIRTKILILPFYVIFYLHKAILMKMPCSGKRKEVVNIAFTSEDSHLASNAAAHFLILRTLPKHPFGGSWDHLRCNSV